MTNLSFLRPINNIHGISKQLNGSNPLFPDKLKQKFVFTYILFREYLNSSVDLHTHTPPSLFQWERTIINIATTYKFVFPFDLEKQKQKEKMKRSDI